jgi:hypothetical protein
MTEGCLGPEPPRVHGRVLGVGSVQTMVFEEGDDPPFLDLSAVDYVGKNKGINFNTNLLFEFHSLNFKASCKFYTKEVCINLA